MVHFREKKNKVVFSDPKVRCLKSGVILQGVLKIIAWIALLHVQWNEHEQWKNK